jgi:hypothetical protein
MVLLFENSTARDSGQEIPRSKIGPVHNWTPFPSEIAILNLSEPTTLARFRNCCGSVGQIDHGSVVGYVRGSSDAHNLVPFYDDGLIGENVSGLYVEQAAGAKDERSLRKRTRALRPGAANAEKQKQDRGRKL